jgi:acetylornithine deacetylase
MTDAVAMIRVERLRKLLARLIDIYSPAGKEQEVVDFLHDYLTRRKMPVRLQRVDERRSNLIVMPPGAQVQLGFIGHVDTIAAHDLEAYGYREEADERVYGLGAADMKGGCAAMIETFLTLWENGHTNCPVALALVVGEEDYGDGAQRLVREYNFSAAIVGEPTDLHPCLSHYGYLEIQLTTQGQRVHASLAPQANNAATAMLRLLLAFIEHFDRELVDGVYNLRDLTSARSGFAVPDSCEAWIDLHLPALTNMGQLTFQLEELHAKYLKANDQCESAIHFNAIHAGYELPQKGPLVSSLEKVFKQHQLTFSPTSFPSHSDANILWAAGIKPILLGPGQLEKAHTAEECVSVSQVKKAAQIYLDLILTNTLEG